MPRCQAVNNALATLAAAYTNGVSTSFTVQTGKGSLFGTPSVGSPLRITVIKASAITTSGQISDLTKYATFRCTSRSGDVLSGLTLESGTAQSFAIGDIIGNLAGAAEVNDLNADLATAETTIASHTTQIAARLVAGSNLSDLTSASTARTNLGLGTVATHADSEYVHVTGNETIAGTKTFSSTIVGSITGNAATVTNGVVTSGSYADPSWITSLAFGKVNGLTAGSIPYANGSGALAQANANLFWDSASSQFRLKGSQSIDGTGLAASSPALIIDRETATFLGKFNIGSGSYEAATTREFSIGVNSSNLAMVFNGGSFNIKSATTAPIQFFVNASVISSISVNGIASTAILCDSFRTNDGNNNAYFTRGGANPNYTLTFGSGGMNEIHFVTKSGADGVYFDCASGATVTYRATSSTTADQNQAKAKAAWATSTHASRTGRLSLFACDFSGTDRECVRCESSGTAPMLGLYGVAAVIQHATTGQTAGFTAGSGTAAKDDSTFTGGVGSTAYTIGDVVKALKNLGAMAA